MHSHYRPLPLTVLAIVGALVCAPAAPQVNAQARGRTRDVYVSVTDKSGAPAKDLAPTDFSIKEDNQSREVLAIASAAKTPMRIALLIDNSQVTQSLPNELRQALTGFINTLLKASPDSTISVATFGDRPTPVLGFTNAAPILVRSISKIFPVSGAGAYLIDAVVDAAKDLRKDPAPRQLIVAFVDESGEEFSNSGRQQALEALRNANASLWVVAMQSTTTNLGSAESRDRSALIDEGVNGSGGATLSLLNRLSLPPKMLELATMLTSQVQVTYGRPEQMVPPKKLEIQLTRKDLRLQAPRWAGQ